MSEATSDFHPRPPPAVPRRRRAVPSPRRAERREPEFDPESDPRLEAALSLRNPVYPLDPPLVDVRIPVKEPHADATAYSRGALRDQFPHAQVGDDLHILFTEPGKTKQTRLSPDIFVALKVPRRKTRGDYDVDALGPPDFVLEVVSRSTWRHDVRRKLDCYQQIGVRECMFFDATGEDRAGEGELWGYALTPERAEPSAGEREGPAPRTKEPSAGEREGLAPRKKEPSAGEREGLAPRKKERLEEVALPNGERGLRSEVLGLVAYVAERTPPSGPHETWALTMRWHDPATGTDISDEDQVRAERRTERARANAERTRADSAEHEAQAQQARAEAAERETQAALRQLAALQERLDRKDAP